MLAKAKSCAVVGLDGFVVDVEVDISPGLPRFDVVGLADTAVQEARARVRAAIRNSGCEFPLRRITANLAPADVRKAGSGYDLPIAVAVLQSSGQIPTRCRRITRLSPSVRLGLRTTRFRMPGWSAAVAGPGRARSR